MKRNIGLFLTVCLSIASGAALADVSGLNADAMAELQDAGVDKYLGTTQPVKSDHGVWTKHAFDRENDGPICIAGTPYSVFTRQGHPKKLLIFLQGGGACWQGFYNCNILA